MCVQATMRGLCDTHLSCIWGIHIDDSAHALEVDASYHTKLPICLSFPRPLPLLLLLWRFDALSLLA